jgi:NADH-quinone oxidoreductase subunit L
MAVVAAFLTAFYMTRQMAYVFFGSYRGHAHPHESPAVMTLPLKVLAGAAVLMSIPATPAWPWFENFILGEHSVFKAANLMEPGFLRIAGTSMAIVFFGIGFGFLVYGRRKISAEDLDPIQAKLPAIYTALGRRLYVDELYNATLVRGLAALGFLSAWVERWVWQGAVSAATWVSVFISRLSAGFDRNLINFGFDSSCEGFVGAGDAIAAWQNGRVQGYLRMLGVGMVVLLLVIAWLMA